MNPGDIFELDGESGPVLVQLTHRHGTSSDVVRVLPRGDARDLEAVARQEALMVAMVPLSGAIESGRLKARRLGSAAIPEAARAFPTFRMAIRDKKDGVRGDVAYWWFWDGEGLVYSADPPAESEHMPYREVLSVDEFLRRARQLMSEIG
ncbi:MAG: hypothetical protein K5872_12870 [Rhizobiaceae bacterium]|nr:hypothetical protein [Rhizobiaceae bacterium]MCV0407110.1 hypothetical protein [Rhizobiaceae bacterium]